MKMNPGRNSVCAIVPAAMIMRMFIGMTVDFPGAMNAAWLCPLLGAALYLPFGFAVNRADGCGNLGVMGNLSAQVPRMVRFVVNGLFFVLLSYDAAVHVRLAASSSNIIALNNVTVHLLILPMMAITAISVLLGVDAVGNSARVALRILPVFVLITLAVQIRSYEPGWLTPVLGAGTAKILQGGAYCAGNMALLTLPWMLSCPDRKRNGVIRYALIASVCTSLLLLAFQMTFPAMIHTDLTRAARIELILSNGRMSRSPQFVLDLLWYGGLLYLIAAEAAAASVFLKRLLPRISTGWIALSETLCIGLTAVFNRRWLRNSSVISLYFYPLTGAAFVIMFSAALLHRNRRKNCEKS